MNYLFVFRKFERIRVVGTTGQRLSTWIKNYAKPMNLPQRQEQLLQNILPMIENVGEDMGGQLLKDLSRTRGALEVAMTMRDDLSSLMNVKSAGTATSSSFPLNENSKIRLKQLDKVLQQWLSYSLSLDTLELRRITFDSSSGSVLEKVARGESVHRVRSLTELKRRLHDGKRCFALFHPALADQPLVFIHVGLTTDLSKSLAAIDQYKSETSPTHAIFYSVNSPLSALRK